MGAYFVRRIIIAIPVLIGITMIGFFVLSAAPGDPVLARIQPEVLARLTAEDIEARRRELGLDQPIPVRYVKWLADFVQGDLGYSIVTGRRIVDEIGPRIVPTLLLMSTAIVISIVIGVPFGVLAALHHYGKLDYLLSAFTIVMVSAPTFLLGLLALYIFGVSLRWLPVGDIVTFGKENDLVDRLAHLTMPALILGLANAAALVRYTRASMLEVIGSEFMTTAHSKGLGSRIVLVRHGLRNALIPVITIVALLLPELLAGAVITETLFNWPGMGQLSVRAANDRDPALMMGIIIIVGAGVLISSIVADLAYALADPRIRFGSRGH